MLKRIILAFFFIVLVSGHVFATEFSADTIMKHKNAGETSGKIYYKADMYRMDMKSPQEMIMITRMDKQVIWNIMPSQRMYMEMPFNLTNRPMVEEKIEGEVERKKLGNEIVNGHPSDKFLITIKTNDTEHQVYQWWATDINFPVKNAAVDGSWVQEYKNIKLGPQPNSLFEVPGGYKKLEMPGGLNMMNMMNMGK